MADVGGDLHSDLLGASTGYDSVKKVAYVAISYNNSGAAKPALKFAAVDEPAPPPVARTPREGEKCQNRNNSHSGRLDAPDPE